MVRQLAWLLSAAVAAVATAAADPPKDPPPAPITVTPDEWERLLRERSDLLLRGDKLRMGRFDQDGNFIPYPEIVRASGLPGGPNPTSLPVNSSGRDNRSVYEHRSGRLIRGTLVANPRGVFVPEIGSTIIDLKKDYDIKTADRRVYNMRETSMPSPIAPEPPKAGQPAGWKLVPFREAYPNSPEIRNPWFARVIGDVMELGHLSDEGEFVPDYGLPVFPYVKVKAPDVLQDGSGRTIYYTLPVDGGNNIKVGEDAEGVYEYRSGRLIKGTLQKTGNFVPELGSKVLDFKDYDPAPLRKRRIYNLPGVLRKAE